jgi:hypothetical protein
MLTGHNDASQDGPQHQPQPPVSLLRQAGEQLVNRGLRVRERVRGGELTAIESTNPSDPNQSRVTIGCDGFLTWERWYTFRTTHDAHALAQVAATLLHENPSQQAQHTTRESR